MSKTKKLMSKDGRYIMTKQRRQAQGFIEISISELKRILKHAENMKETFGGPNDLRGCFKHLSEDVSFYIKFK